MKIDLEQIKDCEYCSYIFGSFGCCVTVNNEWVYSCKEGQKEYWLGRVIEIINEEDRNRRNELGVAYDNGSITVADRIRERVFALKRGEQE